MTALLALGLLTALLTLVLHWRRGRAARSQAARAEAALAALRTTAGAEIARLQETIRSLELKVAQLAKWERVRDAEATASEMLREAEHAASSLRRAATEMHDDASRAAASVRARAADEAERLRTTAEAEAARLTAEAEQIARDLRDEAIRAREAALSDADVIRRGAAEEAQEAVARLTATAAATLEDAHARAAALITDAEVAAETTAGEALKALRQADQLERTVQALRNTIEGYGDEYIIPVHALIDDLAEDVGHTETGQKLKAVRDEIRRAVRAGAAATCDYVEENRRVTAIRFVVDAFNGKADSVLARVRHDNFGKLKQELKDDFTLVNHNGRAFRNARILPTYLDLRIEELRLAAVAHELKLQEREEQRRIKEQLREEEKARREYERAIRETAKEEETLRRAIDKATQQLARASEEQKARYEQQLLELSAKLQEAEAQNQRAVSMAQQTKRGHVYIISNMGSFGEHVYKIGLTRRLDPLERIRELGDSSVPFEFDVHALIFAEDAPALEYQLHRHFVMNQVNKVNYRKEFFRVDLTHIRSEIETLGLATKWTMAAAAQTYRESLAIENLIASDATAREAWLRRQLTYEAAYDANEEEDQVVAAPTTSEHRDLLASGVAAE